jgi:hypothetical protein
MLPDLGLIAAKINNSYYKKALDTVWEIKK